MIGAIAGAGLKSFLAELGGKAPIIVFGELRPLVVLIRLCSGQWLTRGRSFAANTDLDTAVNGVAFASFIASGQTCVAGTRIIIERSIYSEFVSKLKLKCASIEKRIGSPFDERSMMGPVISEKQLGIVEGLVESAKEDGATIVCGGERMKGVSVLDGKTELSKG